MPCDTGNGESPNRTLLVPVRRCPVPLIPAELGQRPVGQGANSFDREATRMRP